MKKAMQIRVNTGTAPGQFGRKKGKWTASLYGEEQKKFRLSVKTQDEAVVVSAEFHLEGDREQISQAIRTAMEHMAQKVQEKGGIVGHIKASVDFQETAVFSVTLDHADVREGAGCDVGGRFAAILLLLEEDCARKLAEQMFDEITGQIKA